jgi:hypothetical protein
MSSKIESLSSLASENEEEYASIIRKYSWNSAGRKNSLGITMPSNHRPAKINFSHTDVQHTTILDESLDTRAIRALNNQLNVEEAVVAKPDKFIIESTGIARQTLSHPTSMTNTGHILALNCSVSEYASYNSIGSSLGLAPRPLTEAVEESLTVLQYPRAKAMLEQDVMEELSLVFELNEVSLGMLPRLLNLQQVHVLEFCMFLKPFYAQLSTKHQRAVPINHPSSPDLSKSWISSRVSQ